MACFHACLNELPSELRGFAFKGTDLTYIHCFSNENFAVTVKDFTFVSLVCREVHISNGQQCGKHMQTKKISHPSGCCEFSSDELFAGERIPELIRILKFFL